MPIINITLEMWVIFCILAAIVIITIYIIDTKRERSQAIEEHNQYHKYWEKKLKQQDKKIRR